MFHPLHLAIFKNYIDLLCTYFCGFDFTFKFNRIQNLTQMCQRNVFLYPKLKIFVSLNLSLYNIQFCKYSKVALTLLWYVEDNMYIFHFKFYVILWWSEPPRMSPWQNSLFILSSKLIKVGEQIFYNFKGTNSI